MRLVNKDEDDIRLRRDLLTVVRCMLCLIPKRIVTLRDELTGLLDKLSYPERKDIANLNKELSMILFSYYSEYITSQWMESVIAIYLDKNVSEIEQNTEKAINNLISLDKVKELCDSGKLEASLEIFEDDNKAYINLTDINTNKTVVLKTLP